MEETKSIRYGGLDLLKHILAIFVIIHHMTSESRYSVETNKYISDIVIYVNGAVIGFFILSGFFFKSSNNLYLDLEKAFKRIMIPYFIFSIFYTIALSLLGKLNFNQGFLNTLILKGSSMQLYFLPYLFFIFCLYFLLFQFKNEVRNLLLILILVIFIGFSLMFSTKDATGSSLKLIPIYIISFGLGVFLSLVRGKSEMYFFKFSVYSILLNLLIGFYDFRFFYISGMLFLVLLAYGFSKKISFLNKSFPGSGGVYLFHTPILNFSISTILVLLGIVEIQNLYFSIMLTYIISLAISLTIVRKFPKLRMLILE